MNLLHRIPSVALGVLIASSAMLFVSCRTSRQETRRGAPQTQASGQTSISRQMDSLLLIQEKLIEVIDSMTGLVNADHSRIRNLERQMREMQSRAYGTPQPPTSSYESPTGSYQPPASQYESAQGSPQPPASSYSPPTGSSQPHLEIPHFSGVPNDSQSPDGSGAYPSTTPTGSTDPSTIKDRYSFGLKMFNENSFEAALKEFQSLERDDPNGSYAPNYHYWEGECYYAEKRYNMALQTFGTTISQFPNSAKAAAAQFKMGECYEKLNIPSSARAAYERVIADYPSSDYKARAQTQLNALKN